MQEAQIHMQNNNWDSAKIYAVHVLAEADELSDISMAQTIISLAKDHLEDNNFELEKQRRILFDAMLKRFDLIEEINWYYDPLTASYTNQESMHLYIGKKKQDYWLRFRVQYAGNFPLSILGYTVFTDKNQYTFSPNGEVKKGQDERKYWEWFDQRYDPQLHEMVEDVLFSKRAELVLIGKGVNHKRLISTKEKIAMRRILRAYEMTPRFNGYEQTYDP
ncbi:MAG: hypothetical protein AAF696_32985 [Bacteroidota bacterium]